MYNLPTFKFKLINKPNDDILQEHKPYIVSDRKQGSFASGNYFQNVRKPCTCGTSSGLTMSKLNSDQVKFVRYVESLTRDLNFDISVIILDGGPGCGKSTLLSFIMTRMRHLFDKVRLTTEKLINIEDHNKKLCQAHLMHHAGLGDEKYGNSMWISECIMSCTVSKIIYDIMGERNTDCERIRLEKRDNNDTIKNINAYRSEIDGLIEKYLNKYKIFTKPSADRQLHLYIIDECAMIPPEKLYFLIGYLHRRDTHSRHIFILSGDVDQVEPIGHENTKLNVINNDNYAEDWFPIGMCNDMEIVCMSMANGYKYIIERFQLTEPTRAAGDQSLCNFIKLYKSHTNIDDKKREMCDFISSNFTDRINKTEISVDCNKIEKFIKNETGCIDFGFKIIVRSNQMISNMITYISREIQNNYPYIVYITENGDNLILGMTYTLLKTIDKKKILCNRSVVCLTNVNINNGEIETIDVHKINDPMNKYTIGPVMNSDGHLGFPIQMEFIDNSYQIQGMTISQDLWLDMHNCEIQHRYVMLTRSKNLNQIKSILNI